MSYESKLQVSKRLLRAILSEMPLQRPESHLGKLQVEAYHFLDTRECPTCGDEVKEREPKGRANFNGVAKKYCSTRCLKTASARKTRAARKGTTK